MKQSSYPPLYIDPDSEAIEASTLLPRSGCGHFLRWLHNFIPFRFHYKFPYGRASVEQQLRNRDKFPEVDWLESGISMPSVTSVTGVVQIAMNHPNCHYLPNDALELIMIGDYDDFPPGTICLVMSKRLDIKVTPEWLMCLAYEQGGTVADFIRELQRA